MEPRMNLNTDRTAELDSDIEMSGLLQVASNIIGIPVADVEALVCSELETSHLLQYIFAMMSKQMN